MYIDGSDSALPLSQTDPWTHLTPGVFSGSLRSVEISGQQIDASIIGRITSIVKSERFDSRTTLSRRICELMEWRSSNGRLQEMSCRKVLNYLQSQGIIALPETAETYSFRERSVSNRSSTFEAPGITCSLKELGNVEVVPVSSRYAKSSGIWNEIMGTYHYLGSGPLCGAQIRYLIRSEAGEYLGGLSFSAATWRLKARDKWIGWSEKARRENLCQVVCNSRFLILPTVRVPHLASHVLSLCVGRLCDDWEARYGLRPVLVETFIDGRRFKGTSYRASNWIHLGQTAGRSTAYANGKVSDGKKEIFVYPLTGGTSWQRKLCSESKTALSTALRPESFTDWTEEEFGTIEVYDKRLKERLYTVASDFFSQPGVTVPQACGGSVAKAKAAYRFFNNENINMDILLKPHVEATAARMRQHKVILAAQDTTTLDYTAHPEADDLGPICHKNDNCIGLVLHDTVAFSVEGTPLGVLDAQCWSRDPKEAGKKAKRGELPIEQKESFKWLKSYRAVGAVQPLCPETMLVSVGDREADIYELFHEAVKNESGPELLVRADKWKKRKVEQELLWDKMVKEPVAECREIQVPRTGKRKARKAELEIRFSQVTLEPPQNKALPRITIWAVYARETNYAPDVKEPIDWMLLTTVEVSTLEEAEERIRWYGKRWGIEVYHRTLKSGCRIEDRRLDNADRLTTCIAIDMVVAWRVFLLTMQSRENPELPCDACLSEDEWRALCVFYTKKLPPKKPPSIKEAVLMIAKLGGFLGRKSDGNPGTTTVWRGLARLEGLTLGFKAAEVAFNQRDGP